MASITGVDGKVTIPAAAGIVQTTNIHFFEWEADIVQVVEEDSNFDGAVNWKGKVALSHQLVGTARGTMVSASDFSIGDFGTVNEVPNAGFILQSQSGTSTNSSYTFSGMLSNIRTEVKKPGRVFVFVSFKSSGAIGVVQRADAG